MKKYQVWPTATTLFAILLIVFGVSNLEAQPNAINKQAVAAIMDCEGNVDWMIVVSPEQWMAIHNSELTPSQINFFLKIHKPMIIETPERVCM